ncbi:hypothetical protein [Bathymodiolus japonicus methanotrophic gill symbiont]|nr:hypothetical protein [Bathymodiolus japonicus methanotrophic gill symbiont]
MLVTGVPECCEVAWRACGLPISVSVSKTINLCSIAKPARFIA